MTGKKLKAQVIQVMSETAPSWGYRIYRLLALVGVTFCTPEELGWTMMRDAHRQIRSNPEALKAANEGRDWPPLRSEEGL